MPPAGYFRRLAQFTRSIFIDLRLISVLMVAWLAVVLLIMVEIGVFANSKFVAFGPRKELSFMHVSVDTPYKYGMLVAMIIVHTLVSDFISDSLNPHLLNALQNTASRYIPHRPHVYYTVTTIYAFYCGISQLFIIFIAFAQLDLLIVRMVSDILANLLTTSLYLQDKTHDPLKFNQIEEEMTMMLRSQKDEDPVKFHKQPTIIATVTHNNINSSSSNYDDKDNNKMMLIEQQTSSF